MFPYLVLDQNQLRNTERITAAASRCQTENLKILIPDGAGFEMSKSPEIFDTWKNSLQLLAFYKDLVVVSGKMTDLIKHETSTGFSSRDIATDGTSVTFRRLLADLAVGNEDSLSQLIVGPVKEMLPASREIWTDSEAHHQMIIQIRNLLCEQLTDEELRSLRRDPSSELASWIKSSKGIRFVYAVIQSFGVDKISALRLAATPCVLGSFVSSLALMALFWSAFGGLETAKPGKITNDLHDIEYAVMGSLSVELFTSDKRLKAIEHAVSEAQVARNNWVAKELGTLEFTKLIQRPKEGG